MINRGAFTRILAYVQRTGVPAERETQLRPGRGGRPRALRVDVLLAAIMLTAAERRTLSLTTVHAVLTEDLPTPVQQDYGIRRHGRVLTIRQLRYTWNAITDLFEHSPHRRPDLDEHDRRARAQAMQQVIDQLTSAASLHIGITGRYAIDATAIESSARGRGRRTLTPPPPAGHDTPPPPEDHPGDPTDGADEGAAAGGVRQVDPDAAWGIAPAPTTTRPT